MGKEKERIGEVSFNNFGSKMIVIAYRSFKDIDIWLPEYDEILYNKSYENFKRGDLRSMFEPRVWGVGYLNCHHYKERSYCIWAGILQRCYDEKVWEKRPRYKDCEVHPVFHSYFNFREWWKENYYEIKGQKMAVDKDILIKGNKIYSPDTCVFVPQAINTLFEKSEAARGEYPIGVGKYNGRIYGYCKVDGKRLTTSHKSVESAFQWYKDTKEKEIKRVADFYKEHIPKKLYEAMYSYKVEITD